MRRFLWSCDYVSVSCEPLLLDCELHKRISFLLPTLLGGTGCLHWAGGGLSHDWAGSAMPCLSSFSWGQAFRSTECAGIFQNGPFSCPPPGSLSGFFCAVYCGNLIELLEARLNILWQSPYDWVFHSSVTVQVCLASTGSHRYFGWWISAPLSYYSLYLPVGLCNLGSSGLLCPTSLRDPKRIVGCSICSAFLHFVRTE